jgi:hypothetical protein
MKPHYLTPDRNHRLETTLCATEHRVPTAPADFRMEVEAASVDRHGGYLASGYRHTHQADSARLANDGFLAPWPELVITP